MPHCKEQVTAEIAVELQIAAASALKHLHEQRPDRAEKCLQRCKPFIKAYRRRGRIDDLDAFINRERIDRELAGT